MTNETHSSHAYLVGGGIASLAAAVFLVRDAGMPGGNIRILEELPQAGGALDGSGAPDTGYVARGGRMLEDEAYVCLWNLLQTIPTLGDDSVSVLQETEEFNARWLTHANARLIDASGNILEASELGFTTADRVEMARLLTLPESVIGALRIEDFFSEHFFSTNFWAMWRTTFAFQNWHSAIELKRYFLRFLQELPRIHTLAGVRRTRLNQYDSIVRPVQAWLERQGVRIERGIRVTDVEFAVGGAGERRAERILFERDGTAGSYRLGPRDYAFITIGSMTADARYGGDDTVPELVRDKRDGAWNLWETLARKAPDFGRPGAFNGNVDEAKWESFTLTMRSPALLKRIEEFSGNAPGTGALMTFKDSRWLMSVVVPHQPHFAGQPEDVFTLWGYGLFVDEPGELTGKKMSEATGQEILIELLGHLGFDDIADEVCATTAVTTVMMPYITSQFERRDFHDRPLVVPSGSANFAFLGQFTEIPEDVVFTVEYSVRGAMHAVYELLGVDQEVPAVYHALSDPLTALRALKAVFA
ncbi:oleate hydratase [Streptomyces sp. NBC_00160]|uniref:oleate hydratase n=1 Tax=Streptomyces sp. NBC_00160 TaxID=2903628 RepID=UPI00225061D7|nr:oleate hydratase [Streptomyces sp. NBC_00160]MCX5309187.1 oleate hydratase [Streptomyces sp. NBC_00160]